MADRRGSRRWAWGATAVACGALVLGGAGMGTATAAPAVVKKPVKIANYLFTPHTITIAAGTKVVWTNKDSIGHNVVSTSKAKFASPTIGQGQKWAHVFRKPGTFTYHCSLHFEMTGKVVVTG